MCIKTQFSGAEIVCAVQKKKSGFTLRDCTITKAVWEVWPALAEAGRFVYFISHFSEQTAKNELKSKTESVC